MRRKINYQKKSERSVNFVISVAVCTMLIPVISFADTFAHANVCYSNAKEYYNLLESNQKIKDGINRTGYYSQSEVQAIKMIDSRIHYQILPILQNCRINPKTINRKTIATLRANVQKLYDAQWDDVTKQTLEVMKSKSIEVSKENNGYCGESNVVYGVKLIKINFGENKIISDCLNNKIATINVREIKEPFDSNINNNLSSINVWANGQQVLPTTMITEKKQIDVPYLNGYFVYDGKELLFKLYKI